MSLIGSRTVAGPGIDSPKKLALRFFRRPSRRRSPASSRVAIEEERAGVLAGCGAGGSPSSSSGVPSASEHADGSPRGDRRLLGSREVSRRRYSGRTRNARVALLVLRRGLEVGVLASAEWRRCRPPRSSDR